MANNKNPNQKQPGEKEPGTFHYNPGNMSGKKIGANDNQSEQSDAHEKRGRQEHPDDTKKKLSIIDGRLEILRGGEGAGRALYGARSGGIGGGS